MIDEYRPLERGAFFHFSDLVPPARPIKSRSAENRCVPTVFRKMERSDTKKSHSLYGIYIFIYPYKLNYIYI